MPASLSISVSSKARRGAGTSGRLLALVGGVMIALVASACGSTTGGESMETSSSRGAFGSESTSDPGLRERESLTGGAERRAEFETIYFDFDDDTLRPEAKSALRRNASAMRQYPEAKLEIQGNCDERGTNEYNLALGKRRAEAAKRYLVDLGVDPARLVTVSFGEENPAVLGHNEAAWAKNRRDDFVLR